MRWWWYWCCWWSFVIVKIPQICFKMRSSRAFSMQMKSPHILWSHILLAKMGTVVKTWISPPSEKLQIFRNSTNNTKVVNKIFYFLTCINAIYLITGIFRLKWDFSMIDFLSKSNTLFYCLFLVNWRKYFMLWIAIRHLWCCTFFSAL